MQAGEELERRLEVATSSAAHWVAKEVAREAAFSLRGTQIQLEQFVSLSSSLVTC